MNRPYKYTQQGRLVIQPPSRPYRSPLQGRLKTLAAPTEGTVGAAENTSRPYRGTLCRNTLGRAAGAAAPKEALEPSLQLISVVVIVSDRF